MSTKTKGIIAVIFAILVVGVMSVVIFFNGTGEYSNKTVDGFDLVQATQVPFGSEDGYVLVVATLSGQEPMEDWLCVTEQWIWGDGLQDEFTRCTRGGDLDQLVYSTSHEYEAAGAYEVQLVLTNEDGDEIATDVIYVDTALSEQPKEEDITEYGD